MRNLRTIAKETFGITFRDVLALVLLAAGICSCAILMGCTTMGLANLTQAYGEYRNAGWVAEADYRQYGAGFQKPIEGSPWPLPWVGIMRGHVVITAQPLDDGSAFFYETANDVELAVTGDNAVLIGDTVTVRNDSQRYLGPER